MRRRLCWAFSGLLLLSLLACAGTAWLWWHSYRGHDDRVRIWLRGERCALRSERGQIVLTAPPRGSPAPRGAIARFIAQCRNSDLRWRITTGPDPRGWHYGQRWPRAAPFPASVPSKAAGPGGYGHLRPLLDALDDPDRFAVAHELLLLHTGAIPPSRGEPRLDRAGRRATFDDYGLRVELPPGLVDWRRDPFGDNGWADDPFAPGVSQAQYAGTGIYDPSQIPALRDFWFDQVAEPIASVPYPLVLALFTAPAVIWLASRCRRAIGVRRRLRLGLCSRCGYDLTGNVTGKCSECGAPVAAAPGNRATQRRGWTYRGRRSNRLQSGRSGPQ